ncbi:DNAJ1 [Symbiodinium natans]|uniref:DNAJ1 protein n=1 Tax=Symbiodinium natans TaxID=878477 RepID=A0A812PY12_9DINO|nr:DNAJ1 [Symbiodinium natans]
MATEWQKPLGGAQRSANFYSLLNVEDNASIAELRVAYRRALLKAHPDRGGTSEAFRLVRQAFEVLSNPAERNLYDRNFGGPAGSGKGGPSSKLKRRPSTTADEIDPRKGKVTRDSKESLANLHDVLRAMGKPMRDQEIAKMQEGVRAELLRFMEAKQATKQAAKCDEQPVYSVGSSSMRLRSFRDSAGQEKFSVQLDIDCLRAYTRQAPLEAAIEHQLVLSDLQEKLLKADVSLWSPPFRICQIFDDVLASHAAAVSSLGLSLFLQTRASEWVPNTYCLTSPVICFDEAVALRHRLITARATSWDMLRQAWVALLQTGKYSMTVREASQYVDKAREELLQRRLAQAIMSVQKMLSRVEEPSAEERMQIDCQKGGEGSSSMGLTAAALKAHAAACATKPCSEWPFANLATKSDPTS